MRRSSERATRRDAARGAAEGAAGRRWGMGVAGGGSKVRSCNRPEISPTRQRVPSSSTHINTHRIDNNITSRLPSDFTDFTELESRQDTSTQANFYTSSFSYQFGLNATVPLLVHNFETLSCENFCVSCVSQPAVSSGSMPKPAAGCDTQDQHYWRRKSWARRRNC